MRSRLGQRSCPQTVLAQRLVGLLAPNACRPFAGVLERCRVRQHGNALAPARRAGEQLLRQTRGLLAEHEEVAVRIGCLRIGLAGLLREQVQALVRLAQPVLRKKLLPARVGRDVQAVPVAKAGAPEHVVSEREAEWPDEVEPRAGDDARSPDVSRVGGDLWLKEHDVEHDSLHKMAGRLAK